MSEILYILLGVSLMLNTCLVVVILALRRKYGLE
jgi:hypothetical protein